MLSLAELGPRIVIIGPSNAGKSTLAEAIARKIGATPVFLDQYRFIPASDWVMRPDAEFAADHDAAIAGERWVMDGNYKSLMPQRLARATGIILLWDGRWTCLWRYLRRTLLERDRVGMLEGKRDSLKWAMIRWIVFVQPGRRGIYEAVVDGADLPAVRVEGMVGVNALYAAWGLKRQRPGKR
jgi:adenylate kinase family enzyme